MKDHDGRLLKKIKKGNQQAFRKLYECYANDAIRTVYAITRNNNHTFDIVQEAFLKVYRHVEKFDETKRFKPWFHRILINETMRYLKKEAKSGIPITEEAIGVLANEKKPPYRDSLDDALEELEPEARTMLVLKYYYAYTEKEIADMLDIPPTTVKSRAYRARQELKRRMGGVEDEK